jgi:hypothetical protein
MLEIEKAIELLAQFNSEKLETLTITFTDGQRMNHRQAIDIVLVYIARLQAENAELKKSFLEGRLR